MTYALWNIQERGQLFVSPQTEVYEGMIIGVGPEYGHGRQPVEKQEDDGSSLDWQRRSDEAGSSRRIMSLEERWNSSTTMNWLN